MRLTARYDRGTKTITVYAAHLAVWTAPANGLLEGIEAFHKAGYQAGIWMPNEDGDVFTAQKVIRVDT